MEYASYLSPWYDRKNEVPYFAFIGGTAIVLGVALAAASPAVKKLMRGVH